MKDFSIKIGLVDDHDWYRGALVDLFSRYAENFIISVEASDGKDLIKKMEKLDSFSLPDIIILDINMPNMDGFATADWLQTHFPLVRVVALSMRNDENSIIQMINFGVVGYVHKNIDGSELIDAISAIRKEGYYYNGHNPPSFFQAVSNNSAIRQSWLSLTEKERDFMRECCLDVKYGEIAFNLKIAMNTLDDMREKIFAKFEVKTRVGLVLIMIKNGLA